MTEATKTQTAEPRYATGTEAQSANILAARERVGRPALSAHLGISQSACWRWERNKVHPSELKAFNAAKLDQLPAGKPVSRSAKIDQLAALLASTEDLNTVRDDMIALLK
jgi:hypothetical protein